MNIKIFLAGLILAGSLSACSAYKAGQTPDDVYYSPGKEQNGYVVMDKNNQRNHYQGDRYYGAGGYSNYYNDFDDRYLRMMVRNKYRYGIGYYGFDDLYFSNYYYNPYAFGHYYSYNNWYSPWNPYWSWNSFYNPYAPSHIIVIPGKGTGSDWVKHETFRPRPFNLNSYTNGNHNTRINTQSNNSINTYRPSRGYNNSNNSVNSSNSSTEGFGGLMKKVFSSDRNNNGYQTSQGNMQNRQSRPTRVYNPTTNNTNRSSNTSTNSEMRSSQSNSNSSSGNNSGGGGVTRPNRNRN